MTKYASWLLSRASHIIEAVSSTIKWVPNINWMEAARPVMKGLFWVFQGARVSRHLITVHRRQLYRSHHLLGIRCLSIPTSCFDTLLGERALVHVLAICRFGKFGLSSWPSLLAPSGCDIRVVIYHDTASAPPLTHENKAWLPGHKVLITKFSKSFPYIALENKSFPCGLRLFTISTTNFRVSGVMLFIASREETR